MINMTLETARDGLLIILLAVGFTTIILEDELAQWGCMFEPTEAAQLACFDYLEENR